MLAWTMAKGCKKGGGKGGAKAGKKGGGKSKGVSKTKLRQKGAGHALQASKGLKGKAKKHAEKAAGYSLKAA